MKRILIDGTSIEEPQICLMEEGELLEFACDGKGKAQIKGSIFVGFVESVKPSLCAAFVKYLSNGRSGFLSGSEVMPEYFGDCTVDLEADALAPSDGLLAEGSDPVALFDNLLNNNPTDPFVYEDPLMRSRDRDSIKIETELSRYQKLMVQVAKEERQNKGVTLTTQISLSGKYCVFMPNTPRKECIWRRFDDIETESQTVFALLNLLQCPEEATFMIRSGISVRDNMEMIIREYRYLRTLWCQIKRMYQASSAPKLLYDNSSLVKRTLRTFLDDSVDEVVISGQEIYDEVTGYATNLIREEEREKIHYYGAMMPLFCYYGVEEKIQRMYTNKVMLPSGGYLVIDIAEALIAIDVNSGRMIRETRDVESTAFKANREAVSEIARQLRLRNLSGIIVIDFIDMYELEHRRSIEKDLQSCLKQDRASMTFGTINQFGLFILSRQRISSNFYDMNMVSCDYCQGMGRMRSIQSVHSAFIKLLQYITSVVSTRAFDVVLSEALLMYVINKRSVEMRVLEEEQLILQYRIKEGLPVETFYIYPSYESSETVRLVFTYTLSDHYRIARALLRTDQLFQEVVEDSKLASRSQYSVHTRALPLDQYVMEARCIDQALETLCI